jgi:acetoin utilization protein AcuB
MNLAAIMNKKPITVAADDTMNAAIRKMKDQSFKHLPVVDAAGGVVGIVTDRDLKRASPSDATLLEVHELLYLLEKVKVSQVMTKKPITAEPNTPIAAAAGLLVKHKVGCLPVVEDGKLVGIVTQTDFLAYLAQGNK